MRFARWVFLLAGGSGVLMILPMYLAGEFFRNDPPAINRYEFYYGFAGVTLAWQVMFLIIGGDPIRYRPAMLAAVLEKAGFAFAVPLLYWHGDLANPRWLGYAGMDGTWLVLFVIAWVVTPRKRDAGGGEACA